MRLSIAERFGDDELNTLPFRDVETVLAIRFMRRLPDARSASAGLELHIQLDVPRGKVVAPLSCRRQSISLVNTHGIIVHKTGNYDPSSSYRYGLPGYACPSPFRSLSNPDPAFCHNVYHRLASGRSKKI